MKFSIWAFIWETSELTGIPLGRLAPYVFGKMIGSKGVKIEENNNGRN